MVMNAPNVPSHKLREFCLLANAPASISSAFSHFGGKLVGSDLFVSNAEDSHGTRLQDLLSGTTEGLLQDALSRADLIFLSASDGLESLLDNVTILIERLLPVTFPRDTRHLLLDLSSSTEDLNSLQLQQIFQLAKGLQTQAPVTLVLTPSRLVDPSVKISHLRQQLTVSEILLITDSAISSATHRGFESLEFSQGSLAEESIPVALTVYAASQFLNLDQALRLEVAYIAAVLRLSLKRLPSWVEIQSQFCHNAGK
jgi:hypothetical protein